MDIEHRRVPAMGAGSKWVEHAYFRKDRQLSERHAVEHWGDTLRDTEQSHMNFHLKTKATSGA